MVGFVHLEEFLHFRGELVDGIAAHASEVVPEQKKTAKTSRI